MKTDKTEEHHEQCDMCLETGSATFARIFYEKINGKWFHLCSTCWGFCDNELKRQS